MTVRDKIGDATHIYSLMYSPTRASFHTLGYQIIKIEVKDLKFAKDDSCFYYVWGWPGPDFNRYDMLTYGKGWALTREEIFEAWGERE